MGWSRGSELFSNVWQAVRVYVPDEHRRLVASTVMGKFEDLDCDTLEECESDEWPEVHEALHILGHYEDCEKEGCALRQAHPLDATTQFARCASGSKA